MDGVVDAVGVDAVVDDVAVGGTGGGAGVDIDDDVVVAAAVADMVGVAVDDATMTTTMEPCDDY